MQEFGSPNDFAKGAAIQFVSYVNLTINFRAIAHEQYSIAALTATLAALNAYYIVRLISHEEKGHAALFGMVVGGVCGDLMGIWLTRAWQ
jgi:hypothetical protein